jgi:hypothetical protein
VNASAFSYLFVHANSLAELELDAMAAAMTADMDGQVDPYAHLSADEREAMALAQMGNMDPAAMQDGFAWETPEHEAEILRNLAQLEREPAAPVPAAAEAPDLGLYLERAYAAREMLEERIALAAARVDHGTLEGLLAGLPAGLAPLTQALDAQQFDQWLACHLDGNEELHALVALLICP